MPGLSARIIKLEERVPAVERERDQYRQLYQFLREENARLKLGSSDAEASGTSTTTHSCPCRCSRCCWRGPEPTKSHTHLVPEHTRRAVRKPFPKELLRVTTELVCRRWSVRAAGHSR